jgi:peptidoglycan/LPS O-acetylase OafA/YrhL
LAAGELYRTHLVLLWGVVPCLIALIIAAAIERKGAVLNSAPVVWVGLLSYSLYLWQQPFLVFDGPLNNFFVRLLLTFVMAYVSYRLVEQPMLRLRSRKPGASTVPAADPA